MVYNESMLKIYLLRHGKTEFNEKHIVQGWNDSPLSQTGIFQAKCAGYGAKDIHFVRAYSGDVGRHYNTAKYFLSQNEYETEIIQDMHFREKNYGKYEYGTYEDMLGPLFDMFNQPHGTYEDLFPFMDTIEISNELARRDETGKGENTDQMWERIKVGLDMIVSDNPEGNVLLSTSSNTIGVILRYLFPEDPKRELVRNCSLSVIGYENGEYSFIEYDNIDYRLIGEKHFPQQSSRTN